jgi:gliding motility-associated-like protein
MDDPYVSTQPLQNYPNNSLTACLNAPVPGIFSGAAGGVDYLNSQWYVNTNNSNTGGTIIPGATSIFYTPPSNVVGTQYYYCTFSSAPSTGCFSASNVAAITITAQPQTPIQSTPNQTICAGGNISTLSVSFQNPLAYGTVYTYQWYSNNVNSNSGGTLISGATFSSYNPTNNSTIGNTYYYCVICGSTASNTALVSIVSDPTIITQPIVSQTICSGGTSNNLFVATSGGVGNMSYQWYSNTTNSNAGGTQIAGAIQNTYSPGAINTPSTLYYYVAINNSGNGCNSVNSNTSTISVLSDPNVTITPSAQNLCTNGIVTPLAVSYTGGSGSASYQWYSSSNGLNSGGTLISGATSANYTPPSNVQNNFYYYCGVNQAVSGCSNNTPVSLVNISPAPAVNSQPLATQTICVGGTPYPLNVSYSNGVGTSNYQWWSNSVNSTTNATAIPGANNPNYTPPSTGIGTTYYFCIISFTSGNCGYITSNISVVYVVADPAITLQPISIQTLCVGGSASALAVIATGGSGAFSYQWYNASSNSPIAGANSASFNPGAFNSEINNSYYVQINQTGAGCNTLISNTAQIQVVADPVLSIDLPSNQIYCQNASIPPFEIFVIGGTQLSYQWFNAPNSTSVGNPIVNANSSVFTPTINSVSINFYYCQVTSNGNGCTTLVNSTPLLIEIVAQPQILNEAYNTGACLGNSIPTYQISGNYDSQANVHFFQSNTTGNYDGSEISSTNFTPSSSALGNYSYYFTYNVDYPGCIADTSDFYNVTINDIPELNISSNEPLTGCSGAEIELTNTVSPNLTNDFILVWNLDNSSSDTTFASNVYSTPPIETAGDYNMLVQMFSTLQYCSATDQLSFSIDIVPDPSITEELNFIQSLCPFDEDIDAPTILLDFDNLIGPPTYYWYQIDQNNTFLISNSNFDNNLPQLPMSGVFNSQCVIQFDYPGCDVLTSSLSALTFDENNLDCFPELIIPEAISPNNDGMTDFWTIPGIEQFNGYETNIFNSFGQSIYFVKNTPPNWDGSWNGQTLPNGDYFYSVKLHELNRTIFGTISIAK